MPTIEKSNAVENLKKKVNELFRQFEKHKKLKKSFQNNDERFNRNRDHSRNVNRDRNKNRDKYDFNHERNRSRKNDKHKRSIYYRSSSKESNAKFVFRERRRLQTVIKKEFFVSKRRNSKKKHQRCRLCKSFDRRRNFKNESEIFKSSNYGHRNRDRSRNHRNRSYSFKDKSKSRDRRIRNRKNSKKHYCREHFHFRFRKSKFRIFDIMKFDSSVTNFTKRSVAFFIRRFYHIAEIERKKAVLRIFFMCFKGTALE